MEYVGFGAFALLCAVLSAKWAQELGSNQVSQVIWGLGGLILFPPLIPLILYIRHVRKAAGVKD
jgi:hypothetical protein